MHPPAIDCRDGCAWWPADFDIAGANLLVSSHHTITQSTRIIDIGTGATTVTLTVRDTHVVLLLSVVAGFAFGWSASFCLVSVAVLQDLSPGSQHARAIFSPDDQLVLSGYTLFDVRSATVVHRFDRLARADHGVTTAFHSCGHRVVLNSAVWDLRSMKLVTVCPSLNSTMFRFSAQCKRWLLSPLI